MPTRPHTPPELTRGLFTLNDARNAGLTRRQLQSTAWRRVWARIYVSAKFDDTPELTLAAVRMSLPFAAVFSGPTAAWLHGLDLPPTNPVEATVPANVGASVRQGLRLRRVHVDSMEVVERHGLRTTTIIRTLFDLANQLSTVEAVVAADTAIRLELLTLEQLQAHATNKAGSKGIVRFRKVVDLADPKSESPMETRLRLHLVLNGVPRPESQVDLHDGNGVFLGRVDLYYPGQRLAIEYDGQFHRETWEEDVVRQNRILNAGIRMLRFTAADLRRKPHLVLASVRDALKYPPLPPGPPSPRRRPRSRPEGSADPGRPGAGRPSPTRSTRPPDL